MWWAEPGSNRRHQDFQSCALPTELSALLIIVNTKRRLSCKQNAGNKTLKTASGYRPYYGACMNTYYYVYYSK